MGNRLYIGNLSWDATEKELKEFLETAGKVTSVRIITDHETERSRGFGFADMETDEGAKKAIETLAGKDLKGRKLIINEAKPREERRTN